MDTPVNRFLERAIEEGLMQGIEPTDGLVFQVLSVNGDSSVIQLVALCDVCYYNSSKPIRLKYTQLYDVNDAFPTNFFALACKDIASKVVSETGRENIQATINKTKLVTGACIDHVFVTALKGDGDDHE